VKHECPECGVGPDQEFMWTPSSLKKNWLMIHIMEEFFDIKMNDDQKEEEEEDDFNQKFHNYIDISKWYQDQKMKEKAQEYIRYASNILSKTNKDHASYWFMLYTHQQKIFPQASIEYLKVAAHLELSVTYSYLANWYNSKSCWKEALEWYLKDYESQDDKIASSVIILNIAKLYHRMKDYDNAFIWYERGSQLNCRISIYHLANLYYYAQGVAKDRKKAFELYKRSALADYDKSMCELGFMYDYHVDPEINQDHEEAVKWLQKAVAANNIRAMYLLHNNYLFGRGVAKDLKFAFELCQRAANAKYIKAIYDLAFFYRDGIYVPKNSVRAFGLFEKAAKMGHHEAWQCVGDCYQMGTGVAKNIQMAKECFEKCINLYQDPFAYVNLAYLYLFGSGSGIVHDVKKAYDYISKALVQPDPPYSVYYYLGLCHSNGWGEGVEKNMQTAVKFFLLGAEKGCPSSKYKLGYCYYNGDGVEEDVDKALEWFQKAIINNNDNENNCISKSLYAIGIIYFEKNEFKQSFHYFSRAAKEYQTCSAMYHVGIHYWKGLGVEKPDMLQGLQWITKASSAGDESAKKFLQKLSTFDSQK
jgi:TPR repeat protein